MENWNPKTIESPKDLFEFLLSRAAARAERLEQALEELSRSIEDKNIENTLNAQAFVVRNTISALGQCFRLLGAQPTEIRGRLFDMFREEYRSELAEVASPTARRLLVLAEANVLIHLSIGEFATLAPISEMTGDSGVGLLLDACHAENMAFVEQTNRLIGHIVEGNEAAARSVAFDQSQNTSIDHSNRIKRKQ